MANTNTRLSYQQIGNKLLVATLLTGDNAQTTITAIELGLSRIECAWIQDVNDDAELAISTYAGTSIVISAAISTGTYQILFCIGS